MDEAKDRRELIRAVLTEECSQARERATSNLHTIGASLRRTAEDGGEEVTRMLGVALDYDLTTGREERRQTYGPFCPLSEIGGRAYPAPVDQIDQAVFPVWEAAANAAPLAMLRARFADLMWEARRGDRPDLWARAAIDSYVASPDEQFGHAVEWSHGLQRALELAVQISDTERLLRARGGAVELIVEANEAGDMPGVAIGLLEALAALRPKDRPTELDALIEQFIQRHGDDPWLLESALQVQASLVAPEDRPGLWARQALAFEELANRSTGIRKFAQLQHAIEIADDHGLTELGERLRHEAQTIPEEEFGFQTITAEVEVPAARLDEAIGRVVGDDDLVSALTRLGAQIPSGSPNENREFVRQLMAENPLQFMVTRLTIGPENSLLRRARDDTTDSQEQALIEHESQRAAFFAPIAVEALTRMRSTYGPLADSSAWWADGAFVDPAVADRVTRALALYDEGDFDSASSVLAPRLERIVRRIATDAGLTVIKSPDRHGRAGGVKGLGELLAQLEPVLQESTRRYLRVLLTEVSGLNLRNKVSHGLVDLVSQHEAALLIQAACHLRLLDFEESG